jgi:two-component system sensor histidine kinase DesK
VALQALAVGALTSGMCRLRVTINELHEAREQLARLAVTEERLRFARDLHDLLGHSLSVIALKADFAGRLLPAQADRAAKEVADIDAVARRALAEVRDAVSGYRQPTLAEAVAAGRQALDAAGIDTTCDVAQVALPADLDAVLAWAMREGVTNVIRHSRAQHCSIQVTAGLVEAAAEIVDDGVGHPAEPSNGSAIDALDDRPIPDWAGNGLAGLAERVAALHGRLEVAPLPQGGFRLKASVPTAAALAERAT